MKTIHKLISAWNLISLFLFTISFILPKDMASYPLILGMFNGYAANFIALVMSILLILLYPVTYFHKTHKKFLEENKLGFFNGLAVILFWCFILFVL